MTTIPSRPTTRDARLPAARDEERSQAPMDIDYLGTSSSLLANMIRHRNLLPPQEGKVDISHQQPPKSKKRKYTGSGGAVVPYTEPPGAWQCCSRNCRSFPELDTNAILQARKVFYTVQKCNTRPTTSPRIVESRTCYTTTQGLHMHDDVHLVMFKSFSLCQRRTTDKV